MKFSEFVAERYYNDNMFKGFEGNTPDTNRFGIQIRDNNKFVPGYFIDIDLTVKDKKAWLQKVNSDILKAANETLKGKKFEPQTAAREMKIVLTRTHSPFMGHIKNMKTQLKNSKYNVWKE